MLPHVSVSFQTQDETVQRVYDAAEEKCLLNLADFAGSTVLVEGGGYHKIWLETQPMGGEMYALRNLEAAFNNTALFMRCQRADGRLPGSIECTNGVLQPQFDKYQGFCFPFHALNLYYLTGQNPDFLNALGSCLQRFDACLWRTRDSNGDGLLESFCVYDTGEDHALRYGDAPCRWSSDSPPAGYAMVPMASMDVMSWSFACRDTLSRIAAIRGREDEERLWRRQAAQVADALHRGLWDEKRGACYDRDKNGRVIDILCHNTLRCMYFGSLSRDRGARFVREHLLNPQEFWTPFPLPSVAVSDPAFRNAPENNWSGQCEGLTWQRAIMALENYGFDLLVPRLCRLLIDAVASGGCRFTQQFDPFTGRPSLVDETTREPLSPGQEDRAQDAYGPTMLSVLEYIAHTWGIRPCLGKVWFSAGRGAPFRYEAAFAGHRYRLESDGKKAALWADGRPIQTISCGERLMTDAAGQHLKKTLFECEEDTV